MRYYLLLLFSLCSFLPLHAQPDSLATAQAINAQVWYPFQASWAARDAQTFNSLHTADVLRGSGHGLQMGEDYFESIREGYRRPNPEPRQIEFSFDHRLFADSIAYEVGYYRITMSPGTEQARYYYGYFHVVLRRVDGVWLIAQDFDTDAVAGQAIDDAAFASGYYLEW